MKKIIAAVILLAAGMGCRDRFDPGVRSQAQTFLVVEANLNAGHDSTIVRLTRTFKLDDTARLKVENGAQLTVEGNDNTSRTLIPAGNGYYVSADLNLVFNTQYRLRIKTTDGKEFLSDYVRARKTPVIDSISWEQNDDGVTVFANTKDPAKATRYYRWDYDETWEIHSYYGSLYIYENGDVRPRIFPQEDVSRCWKYSVSTNIPLANSTRLQDDIIFRAPLTVIQPADERLSVRYSILVRQYGLDKEAYNFYELMKKNTEEIGSIFNPQPSEIKGNIRCINDADEYVLGYVTASSVEKKRIFITVARWSFVQECPSKDITLMPDSTDYFFASRTFLPYDFISPPPHYVASYPRCVDCRERGGSLVKPSYW